MSRKSAREMAFKTIFEIPFHTDETPIDRVSFCIGNTDFELTQDRDIQYFKTVTICCFDHLKDIDEKLENLLKGWTIDRLSKVSLAILRLALCEINYFEEIPFQVTINEAVELAKKFADDEAPSFINGVLASAV